ncbi:cytochrome P450 [Aspergillus lucknowensis]|uniref:Cytochrome P450 n=1 Tax=Aspergillus lucknowensis TaxID=176173 RepID=A0ABR4L8G9_9EURO
MDPRIWIYAAVALALWVLKTLYDALTSPLRPLPGSLFTLLSNIPLKLATISGRRIYFIHALHRAHGPIVRIAPTEVSIASLLEVKEIHRAGSPFLKSKWYEEFVMSGVPGVFSMSDPRQHAERRRLFARAFSKSELRRNWEAVVREKVRFAVGRMKGEIAMNGGQGDGRGRCDILKWWTFLATDVAGHLMFGEDFGMLELGVKNEYIAALERTMKASGIASELPLLAFIARNLPIPSVRSFFRPNECLTAYGKRAVTNSRANSASSRNIFSGLVYESEKADGLTETDVVTEAANLIVAGSDTTGITLTYLVWAVLSHPSTLQRDLEDELSSLEDSYDDAALETLPLLNAVIKETLRLYGAAPGSLPRSVPEGGASFLGYFIPGGMTVSTQSYTLHRDRELFPDPEVFDVTRWLLPGTYGSGGTTGASNSSQTQTAPAFSPFGTGPRTCLGIHLAYMELRLAAAEFFRECRGVRLAEGTSWEGCMEPENYFLIAPRGHRCEVVM